MHLWLLCRWEPFVVRLSNASGIFANETMIIIITSHFCMYIWHMLMTNNSICLHQILNVSGMRALNFMISSFVLNKNILYLKPQAITANNVILLFTTYCIHRYHWSTMSNIFTRWPLEQVPTVSIYWWYPAQARNHTLYTLIITQC